MLFKKEFLVTKWGDVIGGNTIYDKITRVSRWSVHHERVFEYEGRFFKTTYSVGATEIQDENPYLYDKEEIECPEVFPVERLVTFYEERSAAGAVTGSPAKA